MSTKNKVSGSSQLIMGGMLTERDVFLAVCRREGAKGGKMRTAKQTEARRKNIRHATEVRMAKRKANEGNE